MATNETQWYQLFPAGAGFLRRYFASRPVRQGYLRKGQNNERTRIMKSRKIIFATVLSALGSFALCPIVQAATDTPDPGSVPPTNTADGESTLVGVTGFYNSAFGFLALLSNGAPSFNTGVGAGALLVNNGDPTAGEATENVAVGAAALISNTTGDSNTAVGTFALFTNSTGTDNTAVGDKALFLSSLGAGHTAVGSGALENTTASGFLSANTAVGISALITDTTGGANVAVGEGALLNNDTGAANTGVGALAGAGITTGTSNTCIGAGAGAGLDVGDDIIAIGTPVAGIFANFGPSCFIGGINEPTGDPGSTVAVLIDSNNNLGTSASTRRIKHDIKPMDKTSEVILALKPVTFKYNYDVKETPCFGLVAEDVAEVDRDLVVMDKEGQPKTVRYDQVNAMLLNEFLKEHKKVEEQQASICQLKSDMQTMVAQIKEQAAQIQKVSAQLQVSNPAPQVVTNKP